MDLEEAILTRRSIRRFQGREVPSGLIEKAISLACWAPNASNVQAWRFFVIKNRDTINRMADVLQARAGEIASWPEAAEFDAVVQGVLKNAALIRSAPVLMALAVQESRGPMDFLLEKRGAGDPLASQMVANRAATNANAQTIASFASQFLLALHGLGLAGVWMVGPMLAREEMEKVLGAPEGVHLFTLIPVGYPGETPAPQSRKPIQEVTRVL